MLLTTAAIIPVLVSIKYQELNYGIAMAMGVLLSSPSDTPGSFHRRIIGILTSTAVAVTVTFLAGIAAGDPVFFVLFLAFFTFGLSMISIYGFRASLISFSGLFALVLSMANISSENSVVLHAALIGLGGLIYLLLAVILYFFREKRQAEELLVDILELTAAYLRLRTDLIGTGGDQRQLISRLHTLQADINDKHEKIRETLISRRLNSGKSGEARKRLLIFMKLVDIFELGMANPINFEKMDEIFEKHQAELQDLIAWSYLMADQLEKLAFAIKTKKRYIPGNILEQQMQSVKGTFLKFKEDPEAMIVFRGLFHFKQKQFQKIIAVERIFLDMEGQTRIKIKRKDAEKFISHQEYRPGSLIENFSFRSPVFRHSLRLTMIIIAGFAIGKAFDLQNAYWILLTSLVIMRPGFALTRTRFKQRLYGTLMGGAIAFSIIFMTQDFRIHAVLAIITFILAFSMVQKNYKAAAAFITLNVVFVYSLLTPDAYKVLEFRLLDTVIGAGLAFLGNSFLWPTWEYKGIRTYISSSIQATENYLEEIFQFYLKKGELPVSYKLARKEAFLAIGNLSAAFQRMAQEPEAKEEDPGKIYQVVSLTQELLSSSASLGTFIRTHKTTPASVHFKTRFKEIQEDLIKAVYAMEEKEFSDIEETSMEDLEEAREYFRQTLEDLDQLQKNDEFSNELPSLSEIQTRFQEARLIDDQLDWLFEISSRLNKLIGKA